MKMQEKPTPFHLNTNEWWVKPLAMLQHNWAVIDDSSNLTSLYFFHDGGTTKHLSGFSFRSSDQEKFIAIVDSLDFSSRIEAEADLQENEFQKITDPNDFFASYKPSGTPFDARQTEPGIYSKQGYWNRLN
jgi:hypothetical protein